MGGPTYVAVDLGAENGEIRDRAQARDSARASAEVTLYQPANTDRWDEAHARWRRLHSP